MKFGAVMKSRAKFGAVMKFALPVLKVTKCMPVASMALSTVCYSAVFGAPFAVGIVGLMFSSQLGRAAVLRRYGVEVTPSAMIPFVGTVGLSESSSGYNPRADPEAMLRDKPVQRCVVILAPVFGMLAFTACGPLALGLSTGSQCAFAVANTGFMMALFSLLPLGEMTPGGELLRYFSKNALMLGTAFNAGLLVSGLTSHPLLWLCFFLNLYRLWTRGFEAFGRRFGGSGEGGSGDELGNSLNDGQKVFVGICYWALFLAGVGGMQLNEKYLVTPQKLMQERRLAEAAAAAGEDPGAASSGGWLGEWALSNLDAVERLESDDSGSFADGAEFYDPEREMRRRQAEIRRALPAGELLEA